MNENNKDIILINDEYSDEYGDGYIKNNSDYTWILIWKDIIYYMIWITYNVSEYWYFCVFYLLYFCITFVLILINTSYTSTETVSAGIYYNKILFINVRFDSEIYENLAFQKHKVFILWNAQL